ncbi:MAG: hypothetical protein NTW29_16890 [Bacteroidetes bacterium]|nr:hypothetical protein [Bacteroidota bacterium]
MDNVFRLFFRQCYWRTGGFIPAMPLNQNMLPGDFFQIHNGQMILLGNIFRNGIIDRDYVSMRHDIPLNQAAWEISDGVSKAYSGRSSGQGPIDGHFEFSKQLLVFADRGSFLFKGVSPKSIRIENWHEWQQALIIKLTTTVFSFRDVYVVTESAAPSDWTLAVAGDSEAELEIATESENFGLVDIFGHHAARTIQSKDIEYYHREEKRKPVFFKAKKLAVQDDRIQVFISELIARAQQYNEWATGFFACDFHFDYRFSYEQEQYMRAGLLDMLQANELNPNTALHYFKWVDANLDDLEKLFG